MSDSDCQVSIGDHACFAAPIRSIDTKRGLKPCMKSSSSCSCSCRSIDWSIYCDHNYISCTRIRTYIYVRTYVICVITIGIDIGHQSRIRKILYTCFEDLAKKIWMKLVRQCGIVIWLWAGSLNFLVSYFLLYISFTSLKYKKIIHLNDG